MLGAGVPISTNTATVESFEQPTPHFLLEFKSPVLSASPEILSGLPCGQPSALCGLGRPAPKWPYLGMQLCASLVEWAGCGVWE